MIILAWGGHGSPASVLRHHATQEMLKTSSPESDEAIIHVFFITVVKVIERVPGRDGETLNRVTLKLPLPQIRGPPQQGDRGCQKTMITLVVIGVFERQ